MNTSPCKNCGKNVIIIGGVPTSKYWISSDDFKSIKYLLCSAQCATDYKEMLDNEAK